MSTTRPAWFSTPPGRLVRFIGSIKFAIPMLVIYAFAMVWGSWIESTQDRRAAFDLVYKADWFIILNLLICLSLIFAVVTRYPWKKKHIGFATVHAGLIITIIGGFVSTFTKIEGQMVLQEGRSSQVIDIPDTEQIEILEHRDGQLVPVAAAPLARDQERIGLDGLDLRLVERWDNASPTLEVRSGGSRPMHAVEIAFDPSATSGHWLEETDADDPRLIVAGLQLRVLPAGEQFAGPTGPTLDVQDEIGAEGSAASESDSLATDGAAPVLTNSASGDSAAAFVLNGVTYPIDAEPGRGEDLVGRPAFPGWIIESATILANATVGTDGSLVEGDALRKNPAIELMIRSEDGATVERHIVFARFPELATARV
ncbi:MAG: hypothetical protein ACOC0P_06930, partial [Planctomycetota bacterium]